MKAPKVKKRSPGQVAAAQKFAAAGRAKQAATRAAYKKAHHGQAPPVSKARHQSALKWAAAGRASQQAKKTGKVVPKKAAAVMPVELERSPAGYSWVLGCNDELPSCSAAAVANCLLAATGIRMEDADVQWLHEAAGGSEDEGAAIEAVLEVLHGTPRLMRGQGRLASFTPADERVIVAGLVVGAGLPHERHAVLSHPRGMVSWGRVLPWAIGDPDEAWALEWGW